MAEFIGSPQNGTPPLVVNFTDQTTGDVTSWAWDFGDTNTSTLQSPSHTYTATGTYSVTLTAAGPGGSDQELKSGFVVVADTPLAAFVGTPQNGAPPLLVDFTDQSTGNITSWDWDFGDTNSSTIQSPSHTYTAVGTYAITLTVAGPGGSDDEIKSDYIVVADPPVAEFVGTPLGGDWPLLVTFTDATTGNTSAWSWDFGDMSSSTLQSPTHTYASAGTFSVTLSAAGPGGADAELKTDYITVSDPPPAVEFVGTPTEGTVPMTVSFTDQSTGPITSWLWNFGDGTGSTLQHPSYVYANKGTYSVTLQTTGPGGVDALAKPGYVVVRRAPPIKRVNENRGNANRQLSSPKITATPSILNFGAVASGSSTQLNFQVFNPGWDPVQLTTIEFRLGSFGTAEAFTLDFNGQQYAGSDADQVIQVTPITLGVDEAPIIGSVTFSPTGQQFDSFLFRFKGNWRNTNFFVATVQVDGLGGHEGDPYLHVTIDSEEWIADYDEDGMETVTFDGSGSHTHEPGMSLSAYEWEIGGMLVGTADSLTTSLPIGSESVLLRIYDDDVPPKTLTETVGVEVVATNNIPGTLTTYYDAQEVGASLLLDAVPGEPNFRERRDSYAVGSVGGNVGASPYTQDVMVQVEGDITITQSGSYVFTATGGVGTRLELNGLPIAGAQVLTPGMYALEARFAVDFLADLPLDVTLSLDGGPADPIDGEIVRHDESNMPPSLHSISPNTGTSAGGNTVTINGFGFFPYSEVTLHWGGSDYTLNDFVSLSSTSIVFVTPPGGGLIPVSVETGDGETTSRPFTYQLDGPVPINFLRNHVYSLNSPTNAAWGPDGRLYILRLGGEITAFEFDEGYGLIGSATYVGVSGLTNKDAIGIAFNPYDAPSPVRLYVGHGEHYANGGTTPVSFSPYSGQVSYIEGPNFDTPVPVVTGLPVSNHDHAVNQIAFDNNGDLFISVGSMTNAGVKHPNHGDLPESPLSAAVVKAHTSRPGFNGTITYSETMGGAPNNDQRFGDIVDVDAGVDVEPWGHGIRNAYGLAFTTKSRLYVTDNGPNAIFGEASTGPMTQDPGPYDDDEINLIEWNSYYGSPNRNRGRYDARQNIYYGGLAGPPSIPETFMQMIGWTPPSSDGIDEYRSDTFQGQIRGHLIIQEYLNKMRRVRLKANGRGLTGQFTFEPNTAALSTVTCPGGVVISLDYESNQIEVFEPDDLSASGLVVHDVFPWRGPASGGTPFIISGVGFGDLMDTSVTIGGNAAVLSEVTSQRIRGTVPAELTPTTDLVDIDVTVGSICDTLPDAFRYLYGPGLEPGRWESLNAVPEALGEVAGGIIDGFLYLVGEGSGNTYRFDCVNRQWISNAAPRTFTGHHHAAEVYDGKLYLIGGISGGSEGKVQIYDPVMDSWSEGMDMPWAAGSPSTSVINGMIYAAGGIVGTFTVGTAGVYDPLLDTWTLRAQMPDGGRNHTAAATDGEKFYIFGGRKGGNFVANGLDETFVYDPGANTWDWSGAGGSILERIPEARGGMGKAIYLRGEFYVFGGETLNDPDATPGTNVYDRVDVYDPVANTWRLDQEMQTGRHGLFPMLFQGFVLLPGGGTVAALSQSTIFDTFTRQ